MSDPVKCCILGLCCNRLSDEQVSNLGQALKASGALTDEQATSVAQWVLTNFDLAPAGSLTAFKSEIAVLVKAKKDK